MKLASFDIFDTSLIRKAFSPKSVFQILGEELFGIESEKARDFIRWRIDVENIMWKTNPHYSIFDIYDELPQEVSAPFTPQEIMLREMQVESDMLVANVEVRNTINTYRAQGYQIAFISDMYLPLSFLKNILRREACMEESDFVFVSCEEKARKSTGELFRKIKKNLNPEKWIHYGDNVQSDFKIPKAYGIKSFLVHTEKQGVECIELDSRISALLRTCRLQLGNTALSRLSVHYVATLYVPYVKWVIENALRKGFQRLYFLSRDAFILQRIAETLPHGKIELRYLFASRKSLSDENQSKNVRKYLQQEGLCDNIFSAIVDVGWLGTTRRMMNEILEEQGANKVFFFYFNSWKEALPKTYGDYASFIPEPIQNKEITSFIEDFCSVCPYPTTVGYSISEEKKWEPVFPKGQKYHETAILKSNIDACLKYAELVDDFKISLKEMKETMNASIKHLFSFDDYVDFSPLEFLPGCDGRLAAKKLSLPEIFRITFGGIVTLNDRVSLEITGGLRLTKIVWIFHNFFYIVISKFNK